MSYFLLELLIALGIFISGLILGFLFGKSHGKVMMEVKYRSRMENKEC
jgi:hypothetical protein